ncbi:hypothetical protein GCM10017608_20210 [Agromyces luteolus]|uniref:Uncharacterized protein n=1 Tax=Agromyces luteolus TaxID=88373 RepID=A0A7C9HV17_9MICO|nr:hypothetical protein [Agromyces luteolus]MUN07905.1 hypothetical protein [Agromyces luteolus]GLK28087.1 hypothetical protein GCM10017608_20210 [Agromyces luteolus]
MNGDPLNPWEGQDRLGPAGDLNAESPDLTGTINTIGLRDAFPAPDANDFEADNEVEEETIETVDPANPPA